MKRNIFFITIVLLQLGAFAQKKTASNPTSKKVSATITTSDKSFDKQAAGSTAGIIQGSGVKYLFQSSSAKQSSICAIDEKLNAGVNKNLDITYQGKKLVNHHVIYCKGNIYGIYRNYVAGKVCFYKALLDKTTFSPKEEAKEILSFPSSAEWTNVNRSWVFSPDSSKVLFINRRNDNSDVQTQIVFSVLDSSLNVLYTDKLTDMTIKVAEFAVDNNGNAALFCANKFTKSPYPSFGSTSAIGTPLSSIESLNDRNYAIKDKNNAKTEVFILGYTNNGQNQSHITVTAEHVSINNVRLFFRTNGIAKLLYDYSDLDDKAKYSTFNQESEKGICLSAFDLASGKSIGTVSKNFTPEQVKTVMGEKMAAKNKDELFKCATLSYFQAANDDEIVLMSCQNNGYARSIIASQLSLKSNDTWFAYLPYTGWEDFVAYQRGENIEILYKHCCEDVEKEETQARFGDKILAIATLMPDGKYDRQTLTIPKEYGNANLTYEGNDRLSFIADKKIAMLKLTFK